MTEKIPQIPIADNVKKIETMLMDRRERFRSLLPPEVPPERLIMTVMNAIHRNRELAACTPQSLVMSAYEAAEVGLLPTGPMGHGYIIPYRLKGVLTARFQPSYTGLVHLAYQTGRIASIKAELVHEADQFEFEYGDRARLRHVPAFEYDVDNPLNDCRFVYAIANFTNGGSVFHVMSMPEIQAYKRRYVRDKDFSPWKTHPEAMMKKTVFCQLRSWLPCETRLTKAIKLDESVEEGYVQRAPITIYDGEVVEVQETTNESTGT